MEDLLALIGRMPDLKGHPGLLASIAVVSFLLSFLGAAVGLVLGHFRLPLLIAYLGDVAMGAACNLTVSGIGALAGAARHLRDGRVSWHCLLLMGVPSLIGAALAAWVITRQVAHFWSHAVIGVMLMVSAWGLIRPAEKEQEEGAGEPPRLAFEVVVGLILGGLAAVTGLMLGSLRLPIMLRHLRIDPKVAIGSNMAIGCMTAAAAAVVYFLSAKGQALDWRATWWMLAAVVPPTVLGGWLGGWLTGAISKERVRSLAGWTIAATGLFMVGQAAAPLFVPGHAADWAKATEPDEDGPDGDDD